MIAGRYLLRSLVGAGGQSAIYQAEDLTTGGLVALKVLADEVAHDPQWRVRMLREAQAMTSLQGTAAVQVSDQVWTDDGALCLVMEYLEGQDFGQYLAELERAGARILPGRLIRLLEPVVYTLQAAHAQGIIHRDVKPANIFVVDPRTGGGVRLLDFGFAKILSRSELTDSGFIAGSPSYIAPETWAGNPEGIDHRIDVYGLAAVMFRALAGRAPFSGDRIQDVMRLAQEAPRPSLYAQRPDLPSDIDLWVERALAVRPRDRYGSVAELWSGLKAALRV